MSTATRIDELRKKFEENPRRYFAPLANECRKTGDLAQAIALCREHLPKQPGHMSGYIVFGQALYESGELVEAKDVFEQALDLDPENLIALRHLGSIARAGGDAVGARRWFERVLEADPRNDDIAAQLATLGSGSTPTAVPSVALSNDVPIPNIEIPVAPMPPVEVGLLATTDAVMRAVDFDDVNTLLRNRTPIDLDAIETADAGSLMDHEKPMDSLVKHAAHATQDITATSAETGAFEFPAEKVESHAETTWDADRSSVDGSAVDAVAASFEEGLIAADWPDTSELVARVLTPRAFTPRSVTPIDSTTIADTVSAFGREPGDPPSVAAEHQDPITLPLIEAAADAVWNEAQDPLAETDAGWRAEHVFESVGEEDDEVVVEASSELPWLTVSDADAEDVEDRVEANTPAFVTETMGELLVAQGFVARAVDVYEELVRRRPYDLVLASRLSELRDMLTPAAALETTFASEFESTFSEFDDPTSSPPPIAPHDALLPSPTYGAPVFAMPRVTPHVPHQATPPMAPYAQPTLASEFRPSRSAREWFAAIAARRVPRRTPPQSASAVESSPEGLATLFGNDTTAHEDEAARALADAFAPVTEQELESGTTLDFEFGRPTPAFSPSVVARVTPLTELTVPPEISPVLAQSPFKAVGGATNIASEAGNAGFSFDRFFPDPATRHPTPPAAAPITSDAPVTEDLAQFSTWLKGLGNS